MKFVCEKDNILKAINSVTKAVAVRTTMPILEGILIQTNDNEVKFTTYDLELGIEYIINCNVQEQGSTVVNSIMFSEIIRKLPDSDIKITLNENNLLVIECEGSLYKLATMNPEEFPELPKINIENSLEIEQNSLKEMIRKTIFAVSTEENRPIFTGCLFEIKNNRLNVVAVDGFRLAWKTKMLQQQVNDFAAVIPGRSLNEINKIILDSFDTIKIGVAKNQALFEMENCKIVTRLLDGEFIEYKKLLPREHNTRIKLNTRSLLDSIERASLLSQSERNNLIKLSIRDNTMAITSNTEKGNVYEEVDLELEGEYLDIAFNSRYLLEGLKNIESEEIFIEFTTNVNPCIIKPVDGIKYIYLLLPVRIASNI